MAAASINSWRQISVLLLAALALGSVRLRALTLTELLNDASLTPKTFAGRFEDFSYEYGAAVQSPDAFLQSRRGDCDDYAILADYVLQRRGFGTRLIHVRVVGKIAHAICYVTQSRAYLDYNNRKYFFTLTKSGPTIREIAVKVADSLEANWTSASEFTFDYQKNKKYFGATVVKTDPPAQDPDSAGKSPAAPQSHS